MKKKEVLVKFDELIQIMNDKLPYYKKSGGTLGHMCGGIRDGLIRMRNVYESKGH